MLLTEDQIWNIQDKISQYAEELRVKRSDIKDIEKGIYQARKYESGNASAAMTVLLMRLNQEVLYLEGLLKIEQDKLA